MQHWGRLAEGLGLDRIDLRLPLCTQHQTSMRRCRLSMNLLPVLIQKRTCSEGFGDGRNSSGAAIRVRTAKVCFQAEADVFRNAQNFWV